MIWTHLIANFLFSSLLTFTIARLCCEGLIRLFNIQSQKYLIILRLFPLIKLTGLFFVWDYGDWSILDGRFPVFDDTLNKYLTMFASMKYFWIVKIWEIGLETGFSGGKHFSVVDIISANIPKILFLGLIGLCAFRYLFCFYRNMHSLCREICCLCTMDLKKNRCSIARQSVYISQGYEGSPFIKGLIFTKVIFPQHLWKTLSYRHKKAIIYHELGHKRSFDNVIKALCVCVSIMFSHIPMNKYLQSLFTSMEKKADNYAVKRGVQKIDLIEAIFETSKTRSFKACCAFSSFDGVKNRIKAIDEYKNTRLSWIQKGNVAFCLWALSILVVSKILVV